MPRRSPLADAVRIVALCLPPVLMAAAGLARMAQPASPRPSRSGARRLALCKRDRPRMCDRLHRS
jgi:hypothetical protein